MAADNQGRSIRDIVQRLQDRWKWKVHGVTPPMINMTEEWAERGIMIGIVGGMRAWGQPPVDADGRPWQD